MPTHHPYCTREDWLRAAIKKLRPRFRGHLNEFGPPLCPFCRMPLEEISP